MNTPLDKINNDQQQLLQRCISVLMDAFKPSISADDATHFFTTEEVYNAILELNPGAEISKEDIYQAMLDNGFIFHTRKGSTSLGFFWCLIQK
jgi:hypothetical protein